MGNAADRAMLTGAAALALTVALTTVCYVIPTVKATWVPQTVGAEGSVPAFWLSVAGNVIIAALMLAFAHARLPARVRGLVPLLGLGVIVQALVFLDAERAFAGSPLRDDMQRASVILRYAAFADAAAGVLVLTSVAIRFRLNRRRG